MATDDQIKSLEQEARDLLQANRQSNKQIGELSTLMGERNKRLVAICKELGLHDYVQACQNVSGHGHYWDCSRCGHGAPGRHYQKPDGKLP